MGYRVGKRVGKKTYVSLGRSGTYVSTVIGGYRVSKFTPKRRNKQDIGFAVAFAIIVLVLGFLLLLVS